MKCSVLYRRQLDTSEDFFDLLLLGGGCLLMPDGLDEMVSREDRGRVRQQVEDLAHDVYPGNRALMTAREARYRRTPSLGMTSCGSIYSVWTTISSRLWW
jgi:hypothetical protein